MNDSLLVRRFEGLRNLSGDEQHFSHGHGPLCDAISQRGTFDEFEYQRLHAVCVLKAVDVADVWMIQRGEDLRLAFETREPIRVERECLRQHLEGDIAVQHFVACPIDLAHAALANACNNRVWPQTFSDQRSLNGGSRLG